VSIGEYCSREVIIARRNESVLEAARLMRQYHVGAVVIVDEANDKRYPVGVVTDRDLVMEVLVNKLDPENLRIGEILADGVVTVGESDGVFDTVQRMRKTGVRRAPVVGDSGELIGIIAVDDLIALIAEEMTELHKLIRYEQEREARLRKEGPTARK
jgi:CBS domain-containing protein